ncbi:MAG: mechanosensitive ion channel [Clostridiales bacterium]|nr:mechanosensitive ion channel [Clostridiales bacterium]
MNTILAAEVSEGVKKVLDAIVSFCVSAGFRLVGAILVLIIGLWLAKVLVKAIGRSKAFGKADKSVRGFALSGLRILFTILVIVTVIAIMGVPMASIVAVIASCGVAIGLALQGSLSNLAGGIMLVIFRPFRVGDYISANGHEGTVDEIGIFCTTLTTIDNRRVVLPNAGLSNSAIVNATHYDTRRVDLFFKADPNEDAERVTSVLSRMAESQEKRLADKPVEARFDSFGEGFAKYHLRVWCETKNYWDLYYALLDDGKRALAENGIKTPLPQLEVHEAK